MPDGPGRFRQDTSCPAVLRCCLAPSRSFGYGALTLFRRTSHSVRLKRFRQLFDSPSTPALKPVWAPPLSLAATQGIILIFLSSGYLDVSVPRVSPHFCAARSLFRAGSPIRTSAGLCMLTARRRISLFAASFFASLCPGIRRTLFLALPYFFACLLFVSFDVVS